MKLLTTLACVGAFAAMAYASGGCSNTSAGTAPTESRLFVQNADGGSLDDNGDGTLRLTLTGTARTLFMSDRPVRVSGSSTAEEFVEAWSSYGFDADAPNAILETSESGAVAATALEIASPSFDPATETLTFTARPLDALPDFYTGSGSLQTVSGDFGPAALFIDDASVSDTQTARIALLFTGLAAKNPITVVLNDPASFAPGSALKLDAISPPDGSAPNPVSLIELSVTSKEVLVNPGDATDFKLLIDVVVPAGTNALQGKVSIGTGAVTLGQVGSSDSDTLNASGGFAVSLDL